MDLGTTIFLTLYFLVLGCLALFGMHRYWLVYLYYRHRCFGAKGVPKFEDLAEVPFVTIQLPIYNEKYVVDRLVDKVCRLDYPMDRLEIQVLDDSIDETRQIAEQIVRRFRKRGFPVFYFHRDNRAGFKAGALDMGLSKARGNYIAIFDADFLPHPDFLKKMIPYFFGEKKFGMVQARWGHLNQDYSLMTQAQSVLLDGHFILEHGARNRSGRFFNFNGTAGIWDRKCIEDAGGWGFDTLTEDLDLSYRAQLKGWDFLFVPSVVVPAELPVDVNGFKSQQGRWAKGSIQTAKKLIPLIFKSRLPLKLKLEAFFHLLNNFAFVLMLILSVMMPLSIFIRKAHGLDQYFWIDLPIFLLATASIGTFYACSQREIYPDWKTRLIYVPLNLALGIGLTINNTKAVIEALLGRKSEFTRTAKFAIAKRSDRWQNKKYKNSFSMVAVLEVLLGLYFSVAMGFAIFEGMWGTLYCLLLFQVGFLYVGFLSIFQGKTLWSFAPDLKPSSVPLE